jgi:hypothetical protein
MFAAVASGQLIDPDVMLFGTYSSYWANNPYFTSGILDTMNSKLGINMHWSGGFDEDALSDFLANSIYPVPWNTGSDNRDPQMEYSHTHYVVCHPESDSSQYYKTKFTTANGSDTMLVDANGDTCVYRYYGGNGVFLSGLGFSLQNKWSWFDKFNFYPILKIGIDSTWSDTTDIAGVFTVSQYVDSLHPNVLRFADTLRVNELPHTLSFRDTVLSLTDDTGLSNYENYFNVRSDQAIEGGWFNFRMETTGACQVFIDYFQIYDQKAQQLFAHQWDSAIIDSTGDRSAYKDNIIAWYLKDTQNFANYMPFRYINSLIDTAMATYNWDYPAYGASCTYFGGASKYYRELIRVAHPRVFWVYIYPISDTTEYTGSGPRGLQTHLTDFLAVSCDSARAVSADFDATTDGWMYLPQFWYCINDCGREPRRKPTESELQCEVYMGLCYDPLGVLLYKLDSLHPTTGNQGILDSLGNPHEPLYSTVKDHINPYIKAIDSTYLSLAWDDAYEISPGSPMPSGVWLDTIYAVSDTPNPDLGWFHVGQFTEGSDKYVIVVNRACSSNEDGDPAPPIAATIKFDTNNLGLGNYVEIIDLATGTDSSDWVGTPDTALATSIGGEFTYSANFGPGEGRLFKLVKVNNTLPNPVTDSVTISAGLYVLMYDWVIDDTGIVVIEPGTVIYGNRDTAPSSINIEVHGKIYANGSSSDSIHFLPWNEGTEPDSAGDLGSIELVDNSTYGEFSYSSLHYSTHGIRLKTDSRAYVSNCRIVNSLFNGIYNSSGNLKLSDSYIAGSGINGLYGVSAVDSVINTIFHVNGSYGIRIEGANPSNDRSYLYGDTITQYTGEDDSQYGIYISDNDYVTIENCAVKYYEQGGILLSDSDAEIIDCDLVANSNYGIYSQNYSFSSVRETVFDTLNIGVKAVSNGNANLGIHPDTSNNAFYLCNQYFVYFSNWPNVSVDSLMAENCWWNGSPPKKEKFYVDDIRLRKIDYTPYLTNDPDPKLSVQLPLRFSLRQNYPNPFNPNTIISFSLDRPAKTTITIYNILGQKVITPFNDYLEPGIHSVTWDGRNDAGERVASGVYFYTIQSGERFDSRKMLVLR